MRLRLANFSLFWLFKWLISKKQKQKNLLHNREDPETKAQYKKKQHYHQRYHEQLWLSTSWALFTASNKLTESKNIEDFPVFFPNFSFLQQSNTNPILTILLWLLLQGQNIIRWDEIPICMDTRTHLCSNFPVTEQNENSYALIFLIRIVGSTPPVASQSPKEWHFLLIFFFLNNFLFISNLKLRNSYCETGGTKTAGYETPAWQKTFIKSLLASW